MHNNGIERTIVTIQQPLGEAMAHLSKSASRISVSWRRMLQQYESCRTNAADLAAIKPAHCIRQAGVLAPRAYREDAENLGGGLARAGLPAECAALSIALYAETCQHYMEDGDGRSETWRRALAQWAALYQFCLLAGYTRHAEALRAELSERAENAERRSQALIVEMGDNYEKERRRLAQDLHDEIGHDLIVLKLYTQLIALDLKKGVLDRLPAKLRETVSLIDHALKGIRHLVFDLGPAVWNEQGFIPAVRLYARQFSARTGLETSFNARRLKVRLPERYQTAMYKVLQGALSNVAAHASARRVDIVLGSSKDHIVLKIEDDGKGFHVGRKLKAPPRSYGLRAMRDRIELLGGSIQFESRPARRGAARGGTTVLVQLPLIDGEAS